ncbi:MAG: hypothetical protein PF636_05635 [Actinomycetota bacterium]|jgi:hypothetical protein|nr:hypothetical protein [Actinomycetota bacterium]
MGQALHECMAKATSAEGDQLQYGVNWSLSRRALLKVYRDRLECGDWTIPYDEVQDATLFSIRQMFIPGYVLKVSTNAAVFHFGLNPGRYWRGRLPFEVKREKGTLCYTPLSIAIRIALIASIAYMLWDRFF